MMSSDIIERKRSSLKLKSDEIENKKRKESPNQNVVIEYLTKSELEIDQKNSEQQSSSSPPPLPSLLSFSTDSINEEFIIQVHQIISSWNNPTSSTHRQYPQFETVRTPVQESSTLMFDCCDS